MLCVSNRTVHGEIPNGIDHPYPLGVGTLELTGHVRAIISSFGMHLCNNLRRHEIGSKLHLLNRIHQQAVHSITSQVKSIHTLSSSLLHFKQIPTALVRPLQVITTTEFIVTLQQLGKGSDLISS